ncbi:MAG TPA: hypothetical protein VEG60_27090 [Candidatus Binatia bacterium]|nr:hypothetical protein [Candidatus Binatia bacterium]
MKESGAPIDYAVVSDAPWLSTVYVGIPRNSARPNAAKMLISVLHTREAQDLFWQKDRQGTHKIKGTKYTLWFEKRFSKVDFKEFTAEYTVKNAEQLEALRVKYTKAERKINNSTG